MTKCCNGDLMSVSFLKKLTVNKSVKSLSPCWHNQRFISTDMFRYLLYSNGHNKRKQKLHSILMLGKVLCTLEKQFSTALLDSLQTSSWERHGGVDLILPF